VERGEPDVAVDAPRSPADTAVPRLETSMARTTLRLPVPLADSAGGGEPRGGFTLRRPAGPGGGPRPERKRFSRFECRRIIVLVIFILTLLFRVVALMDLLVADHLVGSDNELRLGVPLMVGYIISGLQPDPLLALGEEPVVARDVLSSLSKGLVGGSHSVQVVHVVVVVARRPKQLKRQVTYYGRGSVIQEQEFPL